MNKKLAEAIAGIIPNKMERNRWRGILRYGIGKTLTIKRDAKNSKIEPSVPIAICSVVKNEASYFEEWIEWHKKLGVNKFYIYDNESTDNTYEILKPYIDAGIVEYTYWEGRKQQLHVYDDCIDRHRFDTRWIAVIDLDEFIVPIKDKTLSEFLKDKEDYAAIEINWLCYGSSGHKQRIPGSVMERFKYHSKADLRINRTVKSIINPRKVVCMIGAHEAARMEGKSCNGSGNANRKSFRDREPDYNTIRINHYPIKSYEEFLEKRSRGRVRTFETLDESYIEKFDHNDILDTRNYEI